MGRNWNLKRLLVTVLVILFSLTSIFTLTRFIKDDQDNNNNNNNKRLLSLQLPKRVERKHLYRIWKVKMANVKPFVPIFAERALLKSWEHRPNSMNLTKLLRGKRLPQNTFQWLFKDKTTLVYSAHYDDRDSVIKILGFKHRFNQSRSDVEVVLCQYPDHSSVPMKTLYNVSVMTPRPGLEYNTWIWSCDWKGGTPPTHMLLTTVSEVLISKIKITYYRFSEGAEKVKQPIICVKPMVNNYNNSYQLKEFIETSRLWGASKIVLYPYSINEHVIRPLLWKYEREGLVDVHEWKPPLPVKALHAFGQKSHNQHCLYTYMYRYQWAAFIDLDELILPDVKLKSIEFMIQAAIASIPDVGTQSSVGEC